jgi:hypothetical protein
MTLSWRAWDATMKGEAVSAQPNRKQQRLARNLARRDGVSYQAALAQVRAAGQTSDNGAAADPHQKMLEGLYDAFAPTGKWPLFQYISQHWDDVRSDAREVYLDLAEADLVRPAMARTHQFQLREDTAVGVSLHGLTRLPRAAADLDLFVSGVRWVGARAAEFRPASSTELGRLTITSEQLWNHLGLHPGAPASLRLATLMSDEAWQLWTALSSTEAGVWSMQVNIERARRYRNISTLAEFLAISYPAPVPLPAPEPRPQDDLIGAGSPGPRPRAFISYSHQDEAFVISLVRALEERGIGVWSDGVDLQIGDSLIRRIGDGIHEHDFVIAVISKHSVTSSWCEKELSLAVTQGIQSKQVKVLPVRLDEVTLPSFLADTLWVDADRLDCAAVAAALARAVDRHLQRRRLGVAPVQTGGSTPSAVEPQRPVVAHDPIRWDQIHERPSAGEEPVPLTPWLEDRIAAHAELVRERPIRGDEWFRGALNNWDVRNVHELLTKVGPELVESYRGNPAGHPPGEEEAYYERQLAWLRETLRALEAPPATVSGAAVEVVTPESVASELNGFVRTAGQLLQGDVTHDQVDEWAGKAGITIRARGPEGEEEVFLSVGHGLDPRARLEAKLARIQNHILPKVNAGEWTP